MKYFTIKELCESSTAKEHKINNSPNSVIKRHLTLLVKFILDPLREKYGKPITVSSGYRCEELNELVGGAKNSQHKKGLAADITTGSISENKKLFDLIIKLNLPFDQLINENNYKWIHVSYSAKPRKQILK